MLPEPTQFERQREAFGLLKANATRAHKEGDGLLASSLSETALQEIDRLIRQGTLSLPLRDLQWVIIFRMFWLLHKLSVTTTFNLLQKWPCSTEDDRQVKDLLHSYIKLLMQPFQGPAPTLQIVDSIPLTAFGSEPTAETTELVRHLIELTWFHTVTEGQWQTVLGKWTTTGLPWIKSALIGLNERLRVQAQLAAPSLTNRPLAEEQSAALGSTLPLASLWLLNLYGNHVEMGKQVTSQLARYNIDDYQWRLVADFGHTNFWSNGPGDSQAAWIARRRSMTLRFPILVFHDRRDLRINELLLELYRTGEPDQGHTRQEVFLLAMLHELAALRIWDYWMWTESNHAQSEVLLEAAQWPGSDQSILATSGFVQGVRACSLERKSAIFKSGVAKLEFAAESLLRLLGETILVTYPLQQHPTAGLLVEVADLLPEALWDALADWTLQYGKNCREKRLLGFKTNILEHWLDLIPSLSPTSSVWQKLQPEVLLLAQIPHNWRGGDTETILLYWLAFSPIELALELGKVISSISTSDLGEIVARAGLFVQAETARPNLEYQFTRELGEKSQNILETSIIRAHLEEFTPELIQELKTDVERRTDALLAQSMPSAEPLQFQIASWVPGFDKVPFWKPEDLPLLEKLVAAINSPAVLRSFVSRFLNMVQLMAAHGSQEIARRLMPEIRKWLDAPPLGRVPAGIETGPFALVHFSDSTLDFACQMGWLIFQLVRKLDVEGHTLALVH